MPELRVPDPPLADDVVALRAFTLDDVEWVTEGCRDPDVARFTSVPHPYEPDDARAWIGGHAEARARGEGLHLAVTTAADGAPLGSAGLQRIDWEHLRGEIGYWIAPWGRGRGAAPRATRLIAAYGFEAGVERIEVIPYLDNPASQRVAEKAGCRREGVLRSYFAARGERHDCVIYSLLRGEL
ncbi:MAG TPA: GNAT family N-acetyltransferase [Solirubrobacteraceae bacterium]